MNFELFVTDEKFLKIEINNSEEKIKSKITVLTPITINKSFFTYSSLLLYLISAKVDSLYFLIIRIVEKQILKRINNVQGDIKISKLQKKIPEPTRLFELSKIKAYNKDIIMSKYTV